MGLVPSEPDAYLDPNLQVTTDEDILEDPASLDKVKEGVSGDIPLPFPQFKFRSSHPLELILSNSYSDIQTRSSLNNDLFAFNAFLSQLEPKNIGEALREVDWVSAM